MYIRNQLSNNRGISLVELMIALVISSILLLGVGTLYSNSKHTYTVDEEFARLQENARFAMKYLVEDIRMAGYMGCALNKNLPTQCYLASTTNNYICNNLTTGIEGFDYTATGLGQAFTVSHTIGTGTEWTNSIATTLPAQLTPALVGFPQPLQQSDIIIVRHGADQGGKLVADATSATGTKLSIADNGSGLTGTCYNPSGFCNNTVAIVSDCSKSLVFEVTSVTDAGTTIELNHGTTGAIGNTPDTWTGTKKGDVDYFKATETEVMPLVTHAYYVAIGNNGQPALFQHDGIDGHFPLELAGGVENMQIVYGIDTDNDNVANRYVSASSVDFTSAATNQIVSVRISIMVASDKDIQKYQNAQTGLIMAGNNTVSNLTDKHLHRVFTTTIKLRNKGIN